MESVLESLRRRVALVRWNPSIVRIGCLKRTEIRVQKRNANRYLLETTGAVGHDGAVTPEWERSTLVHDVFGSDLANSVRCTRCAHASFTYSTETSLRLNATLGLTPEQIAKATAADATEQHQGNARSVSRKVASSFGTLIERRYVPRTRNARRRRARSGGGRGRCCEVSLGVFWRVSRKVTKSLSFF